MHERRPLRSRGSFCCLCRARHLQSRKKVRTPSEIFCFASLFRRSFSASATAFEQKHTTYLNRGTRSVARISSTCQSYGAMCSPRLHAIRREREVFLRLALHSVLMKNIILLLASSIVVARRWPPPSATDGGDGGGAGTYK